jgi:hypothetical protein
MSLLLVKLIGMLQHLSKSFFCWVAKEVLAMVDLVLRLGSWEGLSDGRPHS